MIDSNDHCLAVLPRKRDKGLPNLGETNDTFAIRVRQFVASDTFVDRILATLARSRCCFVSELQLGFMQRGAASGLQIWQSKRFDRLHVNGKPWNIGFIKRNN